MSIILKGIDLPKDIDELRLIMNGMSIAIEPTEALQIPTPHGRLIDGDKIVKEYYKKPTYLHLCTILNDAPTILEAEE